MNNLIYSYYDPQKPVILDLDALTAIVFVDGTADYFFDTTESGGVIGAIHGDYEDRRVYKAVSQLVATWEAEEIIGGTEYKRPVGK